MIYTNDHFFADTTKDEKRVVVVGRPSLAACRWRARRPAPPNYFHIKEQSDEAPAKFILGWWRRLPSLRKCVLMAGPA